MSEYQQTSAPMWIKLLQTTTYQQTNIMGR